MKNKHRLFVILLIVILIAIATVIAVIVFGPKEKPSSITTTHNLNLAVNGSGNTNPSAGGYPYDAGAVVNLTATPAIGWKFDGWTGNVSGTNATVSILMDGDKSITANFSKVTCILTISLNGTGTTDPTAGTRAYDAGTVANLTATPASGWKFDGWTGDITATTSATTVTMNSDKTAVANFSKITYQGSLTGTWSGQVADDPPVPISGTFSVTIDANGDVRGSFSGDYSGIVTGHVDLDGNLDATGTASGGTTPMTTSWQGKISISGNALSIQGNLSGPYIAGIFSGTGTSSH